MRTPSKAHRFLPRLLEVSQTHCDKCGGYLYACTNVRRRPLQTLRATWMLAMKDRVCKTDGCALRGKRICPPGEGELAILARRSYGLDVVAWIGHQRTLGKLSLPKVHRALREDFGVHISPRQVSNLFQIFTALVHCVYADEGPLRQMLIEQGEIILSLDAVFFDSASPGLVVLRDTISKRILYAERVPTRDTEHLRLLLRKVAEIGVPIKGVISDKEHAQVLAVEQELPGVPHQFCQTHFLKNVVKQMETDLGLLTETAANAVKGIRKIQKELPEQARVLGCSQAELSVATKLCTAALTAAKASGDSIMNPTALKRQEKLETVVRAAEKAAGKADPTATALNASLASGNAEPARQTKRRKKEQSCPLLLSVLSVLVQVRAQIALAGRLRRQVEVVRKVAHIFNLNTSGAQVKRMLSTYLNQLLRQVAGRKPGDAFSAFVRHLDAVADRYWSGLFHCYDVPHLPANNNDLERDFGSLKRAQRKATGRKSTAGGPIETCAEFLIESWDAVIALPNLDEFLKAVTDDQLKAALDEMEKLSERAKTNRRIQRDLDGFLSEVLEEWRKA